MQQKRTEAAAPCEGSGSVGVTPEETVCAPHTIDERPRTRGKFLYAGAQKLYLRGVTYGTFQPHVSGDEFWAEGVRRDFADMSAAGINAVRTYTVPPRWLLDQAYDYGIRVMVGIPWEQHIAFLDDTERARSIQRRIRAAVRSCANHPAVLCYAIGNEIPASIVRWHGPSRIEDFIRRLYLAAKAEDSSGLVTYVNYPTTEYLQLPFLDLVCFNVYLESQEPFQAYLSRLQNIAGERPLVVAETGIDSRRHGEKQQALAVEWQIRRAFDAGCSGVFLFSWTDEWYRGGCDILDWDFGLTRRDRTSKEALDSAGRAFADVPFPVARDWPRISVVVCTYNGNRTIGECLHALSRLRYKNFEVIVIDDGSTTPVVCSEPGVRVIRTENRGLSNARNAGMEAATGEIVAYIDDDAYPDPEWLHYLADSFLRSRHVAIGGPNVAPPGDGSIAECVANAPGGPIHVLLSDDVAEHIPGCNMAFRRVALEAIGGFDPRFRVAGDDVDVCWRLQARGWTLGFNPAAMVWHHRRNSLRAYWNQQKGYGRAEALLAEKWPAKYNRAGQISWVGRMYGHGLALGFGQIRRIYHGVWGSAAFQRLYDSGPTYPFYVLLMPEWYLIVLLQAAFAVLSFHWHRLWIARPAFALAVALSVAQAWRSAGRAGFSVTPRSTVEREGMRVLTALLYLVQPVARLWGRLSSGLSPWRRPSDCHFALPHPRNFRLWSESWKAPESWLEAFEDSLRARGVAAVGGGVYDRWDFEVRCGMLGACRARLAIEEHGSGHQMLLLRCWPYISLSWLAVASLLALTAGMAALDGMFTISALFMILTALLVYRAWAQSSAAAVVTGSVFEDLGLQEVVRKPTPRATSPACYPAGLQTR